MSRTRDGPIAPHNNADAYLEGNEQLPSKFGIKKVLYEIKKVLDRDDVCIFFDFNIGSAILFDLDGFRSERKNRFN